MLIDATRSRTKTHLKRVQGKAVSGAPVVDDDQRTFRFGKSVAVFSEAPARGVNFRTAEMERCPLHDRILPTNEIVQRRL